MSAPVPIALMGAVMLFPVFGMSMSTISVMGVIQVLGILVDDAIVVGERVYAHEAYMPLLQKALRWRYATAALAVAAIIISLLARGRIIFQFFPSVDGNRLYAALSMPEGTPVEATRQAVERIEQAGLLLKAEFDQNRGPGESSMVKHTMSSIGKGFAKSSIEFGGRSGSNIAEVGIELDLPPDYSGTPPTQMAARWRELTGLRFHWLLACCSPRSLPCSWCRVFT